jgi:hypothetical protein
MKYCPSLLNNETTETIKRALALINFLEYDEELLQSFHTSFKSAKDIAFLEDFIRAFVQAFYRSGHDNKILLKEIFPHFLSWRMLISFDNNQRLSTTETLFLQIRELYNEKTLTKERRELILQALGGMLSPSNATRYSVYTLLKDTDEQLKEKIHDIQNAFKLFEFAQTPLTKIQGYSLIFGNLLKEKFPYSELSKTVLLEVLEVMKNEDIRGLNSAPLFHLGKEMIDRNASQEERDASFRLWNMLKL